MNKTLLIFKREYLTRVTKKTFLIMTLLMPILMGALMIVPSYLANKESTSEQLVGVVDRSSIFLGELENSKSTKFQFIKPEEYDKIKDNLQAKGFYALLEIPSNILTTNKVMVSSQKQISIDVKSHIDSQLERVLENQKRAELISRVGIPDLEEQLKATKTNISVETIKIGDDGLARKGSTEIAMGIGFAASFLIYMFVFMYGGMVMRGVSEEKQNRIVEVIISSVKPIQLMMGKILAIAAVGLTQVLIWLVLLLGIFTGAKSMFGSDAEMLQLAQPQAENIMMGNNSSVQMMQTIEPNQFDQIAEQIASLNLPMLIISFIVYFILGYLLYSSLMAAIAAAVDSEEDVNQFMLPVTIPLIAAIVMMANVVKNPDGAIAIWGSHIPFTSPIIMMVRIPFGVPWWELLISISVLAITMLGAVWVAAKIYRTGILMYGKKPTWKELGKWLKYKS
ncbi:MAG TPA: ABC transporter permease [Prolixibacteraceae bacterium]|nr:ABC transporter permease [Prolixibacteraceae bacterium]